MLKILSVSALLVAELFSQVPAAAQSATYYHPSLAGNIKANGRRYNPNAMTAASNNYRLGTRVKVTNKKNKRSVTVIITDTCSNCSIDLSYAAFKAIANPKQGRVPVKVTVLR